MNSGHEECSFGYQGPFSQHSQITRRYFSLSESWSQTSLISCWEICHISHNISSKLFLIIILSMKYYPCLLRWQQLLPNPSWTLEWTISIHSLCHMFGQVTFVYHSLDYLSKQHNHQTISAGGSKRCYAVTLTELLNFGGI